MSADKDKKDQDRLFEALGFQADEDSCQNCLDQLDDYVAAQLSGQPYVDLYPQVALHLDVCLDCAVAYARLYELELAATTQSLPQPRIPPAPDLPILHAHGRLTEQLRAAIHHVGKKLTLQLSADLLNLLRPQPSLATFRTPDDDGRYTEKVLVLEADESLQSELPVTMVAYRDAQQPDQCLVEITVQPTGRSWPDLGGTPVSLSIPDQQFQATTDAWGSIAFAGIPVNHLAEMRLTIG